MKTKFLRKLRRKASKDYPYDLIIAVAEMTGMYSAGIIKFVQEGKRNYILRRVAELKGKRM